ncbi:MAG: hypothetical protein DRI74_08795 [Bacteroidetes bacterium]|nr:MAG: hypothetical protein DRI74_08795 [Bacteroidota bacterium]
MKKYLLLVCFLGLFSWSSLIAQTQPPIIVDDTFNVKAGYTFVFNPLTNDYDPDGYNVYILSASFNSNNGWVVTKEDTAITVDFAYDASGIDSLRYIIWDEQNTQSAAGYVVFIIKNNHVTDSLDINNVRAEFCPRGNFFWNFRSRATFEVPAGSGKGTIFTSEPWIGGLDDVNVLHLMANRYSSNGNDLFKGPVRKSQAYFMAGDSIWDRVWKVTKAEIDYHKNHYWISSYIMPEAIAHWPAHGDTSLGEASSLAPFYDKNSDGVYNPNQGDYPLIKGDQSVFMIINDAQPHTETGGLPLGVELHVTAYAYDCQNDTAFDNTIFLHYDIYNRSGNNYHNTYFGLFTDFDIGYSYDDFIGCDTVRNSYFGYNGTLIDGNGTPEAYGAHPPAEAVTFLSNKMTAFLGFNNTSAWPGDPYVAHEYYNYMRAWFSDTIHLTYGGNGLLGDSAVNFMFPSEPWDSLGWNDKYSVGTTPNDRRGVGSIGPFNLGSGSSFSLDIAYIYARDLNGDNISSVALLKNRIDYIQWFYDHDSTSCGGSFSGFSFEKTLKRSLKIYPVPASTYIWIEKESTTNSSDYEIYNLSGQMIQQGILNGKRTRINISSLHSGLYIMVSRDRNGICRQKFVVR